VRRWGSFLFVAVLVVAAGCTRTKTLDANQLDQMLATKMQEQLGVQGVTVSCPDDVDVAAGGTFNCTATNPNGSTITIQVAQTDDQGNVTFKVVGAG
jgi:hypothetical protein